MRLKSPFKDYYDGCLRLDQEDEPLYVRKTSRESIKYGLWGFYGFNGRYSQRMTNVSSLVVGFGSIVRPAAKVTYSDREGRHHFKFCYSSEELNSALLTALGKKFEKPFAIAPRDGGFMNRKYTTDYFSWSFKNLSTATMPTWVVERKGLSNKEELVSNPRLTNYEFARILPPYQAFQELRMFLCNQAAPQEHIPPVSDSDLLICKGFNEESFRATKPGGPARKRRKKRKDKNA